jgi:hypothetical protein
LAGEWAAVGINSLISQRKKKKKNSKQWEKYKRKIP